MTSQFQIMQSVAGCDYAYNYKEYVTSMISEIMMTSRTAKFSRTLRNGKSIMVIKYNIPTTFKAKNFDIPVSIYLPAGLPFERPEIFLDKESDTGINPKNAEIDQITGRIYTYGLKNWQTNFSMQNIINEIIGSFNKNFPIYKKKQDNSMMSSNVSNTNNVNNNNFNNFNYNNLNNNYNQFNSNNYNNNNNTNNLQNNMPAPNMNLNIGYNGMLGNSVLDQTTSAPTNYSNFNKTTTKSFYVDNNVYNPNFNNDNNQNNEPAPFYNFNNNFNNNSNSNNNQLNINQNNKFSCNNNDNFNTNNNSNFTNTNNKITYNNNYKPEKNEFTLLDNNSNFPNSNTNSNNNINNQNNYFNQGQNDYNQKTLNSNLEINTNSNNLAEEENKVKNILVDVIKYQLELKIKESLKRSNQQELKFNNFKTQFFNQSEKFKKFIEAKDQSCNKLEGFKSELDKEIQRTNIYISELQGKMFSSDNVMEYIIVNNVEILNVVSIEAVIEDLISISKKAFEKGIISFVECVRFIRSITREAMKVKFHRNKLTEQASKR